MSEVGGPHVIGESKLSTEGRVSLPAPVREHLRLVAGDRVQFLTDPTGGVRVVSAQALVDQMWSYSQGLAGEDSTELLAEARRADAAGRDLDGDRYVGPVEAPTASAEDDALLGQLFGPAAGAAA